MSAAIPAVVEEDRRAVRGLDDSLKVGLERAVTATPRVIRATENALNPALTGAFRQVEVLALQSIGAAQHDLPSLGIAETHSVQGNELHRRPPGHVAPCSNPYEDVPPTPHWHAFQTHY